MRKRRSLATLLKAVEEAGTGDSRALAHFELALFHDNNGRELEAVPQYEAAISIGLDKKKNVATLTSLASSLNKTGRPRDGDDLRTRIRQLQPVPVPELFLDCQTSA